MFDGGAVEYREPKMALQEISKDIKQLADAAVQIFNKEHFSSADSILGLKWGDKNKPWVFTDEGVDDVLLKAEMHAALKTVRLVPEDRMKKYDLVNRLIAFINKLKAPFAAVSPATRQLGPDSELPGKYKVLEDWTTPETSYCTYLVYNEVFQRQMLVKTVRDGQYKDLTKYQILLSLWKRISDHPNIPTVYYIELINNIPCVSVEYTNLASLEVLVSNNSLLLTGNHIINFSIVLKFMTIIADVMEYAHSNSVLHLNLFPTKVHWTVQDYIETYIYKLANPANKNGVLVSDFGNLLLIDMEYQQYDKPFAQKDIQYVDAFWPPAIKESLMWLIGNRGAKDYSRVKNEFLEALSTKVDLFCFGALLLFMVNNGLTWTKSEDLTAANVSSLVDRSLDFFDSDVYDRIEGLLIMCFMAADDEAQESGFLSFYDAKVSINQEFGYFMRKVDKVHTQIRRSDEAPAKDQPMAQFKSYLSAFYNEYYFGNFKSAVQMFNQAKKIRTILGKENEALIDSFTFNDLMLQWIRGKVSATHLLEHSEKYLNSYVVSHTNDDVNIHESVKLLPSIVDSRYLPYFDKSFNRLVERYVYRDFNAVHTMVNSSDRSNISSIQVSSANNLMVVSSFTTGVTVYGLDRTPKSQHTMKGVTVCSASVECTDIVFGTSLGVVCYMHVNRETGRIDEKSLKQLFKHEGCVKIVEISGRGNVGMSFALGDMLLVTYDLEAQTAKNQLLLGSVLSCYCIDGLANKTIMAYENSCVLHFTDEKAPPHRKHIQLEGHSNYISTVRLSYDSAVGISCDLSNKIILWNFSSDQRSKVREVHLQGAGFISDIRCTPLSRFFVVKTSKKVIIYEPKFDLIWYEFPCDAYSSGICIDLSSAAIELMVDNRLELYEAVVEYKSGKPLSDREAISKKCTRMGFAVVRNALNNVTYEEFADKYRRMKKVLEVMRVRRESAKVFYSKFDMANPYKLWVAYGHFDGSQQVVLRELPMELAVDFYIDLYSNNQRSYLYSSSMRRPFNVPFTHQRMNNYQQYLAFMLNPEDYKSLHLLPQYQHLPIREPQYFFTLKTLIVKSGVASLQQDMKLNSREFSSMSDKIQDDVIEASYISANHQFLLVVTVNGIAYCYKIPTYHTQFILDVRINNYQVSRIMKAFHRQGLEFDVDASINTFERNCITCCAVSSDADVLVVGYVDGYMHVIDTATKDFLHLVQAHVDMITCAMFTRNDVLITGGIDSNIKVWAGYRDAVVGAEYTFLKHTDTIVYVRSYVVNNIEYILSGDSDGVVYYWSIGTFKADKYVLIDDKCAMDGNDSLVYALSVEASSVWVKKYSFGKRALVGKCIVKHYDGLDDIMIRSILGFDDSEVFTSRTRAYIKVARSVVISFVCSDVIYMHNVDKLVKVFEIRLSSVPVTIRCTNTLNDVVLVYNSNLHILRLIDTATDVSNISDVYDMKMLNILR